MFKFWTQFFSDMYKLTVRKTQSLDGLNSIQNTHVNIGQKGSSMSNMAALLLFDSNDANQHNIRDVTNAHLCVVLVYSNFGFESLFLTLLVKPGRFQNLCRLKGVL